MDEEGLDWEDVGPSAPAEQLRLIEEGLPGYVAEPAGPGGTAQGDSAAASPQRSSGGDGREAALDLAHGGEGGGPPAAAIPTAAALAEAAVGNEAVLEALAGAARLVGTQALPAVREWAVLLVQVSGGHVCA